MIKNILSKIYEFTQVHFTYISNILFRWKWLTYELLLFNFDNVITDDISMF